MRKGQVGLGWNCSKKRNNNALERKSERQLKIKEEDCCHSPMGQEGNPRQQIKLPNTVEEDATMLWKATRCKNLL